MHIPWSRPSGQSSLLLVTWIGFSSDDSSDHPFTKASRTFSKPSRKTSCFSRKVAQCLFTKDVQFEFWKVTQLVPDYTVRAKTCPRAPSILMSHFWLLPGLMLGRAGPVSRSAADVLVTPGKSFAFPVPLLSHLPCLCVTPWQGLIYWVLIRCWAGLEP